MKALIALEDGTFFTCFSFTGEGEASGEVVFNTSMTGYQEILTDPSYKRQIVTMTYPLIGNYGVNFEDIESNQIQAAGFIVKEYQDFPSNYRSKGTLAKYLKNQKVMGIENLDTRALTRHIRNKGAMRAFISTKDLDPISLAKRANQIESMAGQDLAKVVTTKEPFLWKENGNKYKIAAFDFGIKYNILRWFERLGCEITVIPAQTKPEEVKKMAPDGIFLSNGPGDPEPVTYAVETIKSLIGFRPIFGICLGHQLLGLALGGKTYKLKFGHRGANQPVKNILSGRVEITSQNHGFVVDLDTIKEKGVEITHINLNDNTLEGFRHKELSIMAVQYHPEASPGPHDAQYLFEEFLGMLNNRKSKV